jgi:hypothetical protein
VVFGPDFEVIGQVSVSDAADAPIVQVAFSGAARLIVAESRADARGDGTLVPHGTPVAGRQLRRPDQATAQRRA